MLSVPSFQYFCSAPALKENFGCTHKYLWSCFCWPREDHVILDLPFEHEHNLKWRKSREEVSGSHSNIAFEKKWLSHFLLKCKHIHKNIPATLCRNHPCFSWENKEPLKHDESSQSQPAPGPRCPPLPSALLPLKSDQKKRGLKTRSGGGIIPGLKSDFCCQVSAQKQFFTAELKTLGRKRLGNREGRKTGERQARPSLQQCEWVMLDSSRGREVLL